MGKFDIMSFADNLKILKKERATKTLSPRIETEPMTMTNIA